MVQVGPKCGRGGGGRGVRGAGGGGGRGQPDLSKSALYKPYIQGCRPQSIAPNLHLSRVEPTMCQKIPVPTTLNGLSSSFSVRVARWGVGGRGERDASSTVGSI